MCPTFFFFFFNDTATTEIYTLSLHDALPIVPHGAAAGGPAHDVDPEPGDGGAVVARPGRLVASEGEAGRVEPVEPQEGAAGAVHLRQERRVEGHVLGARAAGRVDGKLEGWKVEHPFQPSNRPTCRLSQPQARRLPSGDTHTPGSGPRRRRPRARRRARPCGRGSTRRGRAG